MTNFKQTLKEIRTDSICISDRILKYLVHGIETIEKEGIMAGGWNNGVEYAFPYNKKIKLTDEEIEQIGTAYYEVRDDLAEFGGIKIIDSEKTKYTPKKFHLITNPKSIAASLIYLMYNEFGYTVSQTNVCLMYDTTESLIRKHYGDIRRWLKLR